MRDSRLQDLLTVRDWIRWVSSEFERAELCFGHGTDNALDEASMLVLWVIAQPWSRLDAILDARLVESEKAELIDAINLRIEARKPLAYITGEAWFADERFYVNEHVLVPRSPIAELIAAEFQPWLSIYPERILDMCTGSGCIGLACALRFDAAEIDLVDISLDALAVANRNIALHNLGSRVTSIQSDGLSGLRDIRYDLIVSNPPYVSENEYGELPQEYKSEPKIGLTSGQDGFEFVRRFMSEVSHNLNENGVLVLEVGHEWEAFQALYPRVPFFWPEFESGGTGVFVLTREQIVEAF